MIEKSLIDFYNGHRILQHNLCRYFCIESSSTQSFFVVDHRAKWTNLSFVAIHAHKKEQKWPSMLPRCPQKPKKEIKHDWRDQSVLKGELRTRTIFLKQMVLNLNSYFTHQVPNINLLVYSSSIYGGIVPNHSPSFFSINDFMCTR